MNRNDDTSTNGHSPATRSAASLNRGMFARLALAATIAAGIAALAGCRIETTEAQDAPAMPAAQVSVATVVSRSVTDGYEFTGRVAAVEAVELRPRVAGYIERVNFAEGQEVKEGDVLFEIDARSYRAELEAAEAELARARSRSALAQSEAARAQRLADAQAISSELLDQRKSATTQATADVRAAQARVSLARLNLDFTKVRAPISGRTGRALVTAGNLATPDSTVLTTLVSIDPVHVYFEGDEQTYLSSDAMSGSGANDAAKVRIGLANEEGFPHEGRLDFIDNRVDSATGTIRARALVGNPDRRFTPGLFARVRLSGASPRPVLLIDDKAILTDQDRKYVYVVGEDATAQRRDVRLGEVNGGLRIVESGLSAGDQVVVHGVQKIFFPGMPLDPQPIVMGDPPTAALAANSN
jgi:multidrug efflux system membrane fusion protein